MKLGYYQFKPEFGEKKKNLDKISKTLSNVEADLIVLPELCTTGYQFLSREELGDLAEDFDNSPSCERITEIASSKNMFIAAGIAEEFGGKLYNSAVIVGPEGIVSRYRKLHLFFEETTLFEPGDALPEVVTIKGASVGIIICFDWFFPEIFRILTMRGAELVVQPANLVLPHCQSAMRTRSIENRIFTVTANRTGSESRGEKTLLRFTGSSQITGITGEILAQSGADSDVVVIAEIDPVLAQNKNVNKYNSLFEDRRTDIYGNLNY